MLMLQILALRTLAFQLLIHRRVFPWGALSFSETNLSRPRLINLPPLHLPNKSAIPMALCH